MGKFILTNIVDCYQNKSPSQDFFIGIISLSKISRNLSLLESLFNTAIVCSPEL